MVDCFDTCGQTTPQVVRMSPGPRPDVIVTNYEEGGGEDAADLDDFAWSVPRDTWVDAEGAYVAPGPTVQPLGGGYRGRR